MSDLFLLKPMTKRADARAVSKRRYLYSLKLDGMRAWWDGGVSRGKMDCPLAPKTLATGLWSNNAKPIYAPGWFLDALPQGICLDIELWAGPGNFQKVMSICKKKEPVHDEWKQITCQILDIPNPRIVYMPREIKLPHCKVNITQQTEKYMLNGVKILPQFTRYGKFDGLIDDMLNPYVQLNAQHEYTYGSRFDAFVAEVVDPLVAAGHEGVCFREVGSTWIWRRDPALLRYKPRPDGDANVIGWFAGKETDKGSRKRGMIGALFVKKGDKTFAVSGLNDSESALDDPSWAYDHPGGYADWTCTATTGKPLRFTNGQQISYRYRELTEAGIPKEAAYYRDRPEE